MNIGKWFAYKQKMIKNRKVRRMMVENNIEIQNVTLCLRLKEIVAKLQKQVALQQCTIEQLRRSKHNTRMDQMETEIQHLNEENRRLVLIAQNCRPPKDAARPKTAKKVFTAKPDLQNTFLPTVDAKVYGLIKENQELRKELVSLKLNECNAKKKPSLSSTQGSTFQKNLRDLEKLSQKQMEVEVEKRQAEQKVAVLEEKLAELVRANCDLKRRLKSTGTGEPEAKDTHQDGDGRT